jgi:hypothetical protein
MPARFHGNLKRQDALFASSSLQNLPAHERALQRSAPLFFSCFLKNKLLPLFQGAPKDFRSV